MDRVVSDLVEHPCTLYGSAPRGNIMTTALPGIGATWGWLVSIDGDHSWRSNGLPTFDSRSRPTSGNGNFPLWESCIVRDSGFRALFDDWENGAATFPDLGDPTSVDPNDPLPPTSSLVVGTPKHDVGGNTYVGAGTPLSLELSDDFWADDEIIVQVRAYNTGQPAPPFDAAGDGDVVDLSGLSDGPVKIELRAADPCRTEVAHVETVILDSTAPVVTYTKPELAQYDTDDVASIAYTVDDGPQGSGVASQSVTLDGTTVTNGHLLDMFFLDTGLHDIVVSATDNVGNSGETRRQLRVRATTASLISNVDRARSLGLITDVKVYKGLRDKLVAAQKAHLRGQHATEHNQLGAFIDQLLAQRGKGMDIATADRFVGFARDLVEKGG